MFELFIKRYYFIFYYLLFIILLVKTQLINSFVFWFCVKEKIEDLKDKAADDKAKAERTGTEEMANALSKESAHAPLSEKAPVAVNNK